MRPNYSGPVGKATQTDGSTPRNIPSPANEQRTPVISRVSLTKPWGRQIGLLRLAAKIPILAALRLLRYARGFESGNGVPKGLLIATEPSTPAVILRDDAAADKTLA